MRWRRAAFAVAASVCVSGCGAKLGERSVSDRWSGIGLSEAWSWPDHAASQLAFHRDRFMPGHAWRAPRPVVAERAAAPSPKSPMLPATLMHVQLTVYPKIACDGHVPAAKRVTPRDAAMGPPITEGELAALGAPASIEEVWILAAEEPERSHIGSTAWLGNFLREAGSGGAVHFPPYQDCEAMQELPAEQLPRRVFESQGAVLSISARSPFTARVLEACDARVMKHEVAIRSFHIPIVTWGYSLGFHADRQLSSIRVSAKCPRGDTAFELGPMKSGSEIAGRDDPPTRLHATIP